MSKSTQQIEALKKKNNAKRGKKAAWKASRAATQAQHNQPAKADKKAAQKAVWAEQLEQITGVKFDPVTVKPIQQSR